MFTTFLIVVNLVLINGLCALDLCFLVMNDVENVLNAPVAHVYIFQREMSIQMVYALLVSFNGVPLIFIYCFIF